MSGWEFEGESFDGPPVWPWLLLIGSLVIAIVVWVS